MDFFEPQNNAGSNKFCVPAGGCDKGFVSTMEMRNGARLYPVNQLGNDGLLTFIFF